MIYTVELRKPDGTLFVDSRGNKISANEIKFESEIEESNIIQSICIETALIYEAVTKQGTDITITVMYYSEISATYPVLYTYYHSQNKFIQH